MSSDRVARVDATLAEVPFYIRRSTPHLHTAHRLNHDTFWRCVRSLWSLHNETINVWSHLIPVFLFLHLLSRVIADPRKGEAEHIVFACYLGSCCLLCSFSSVYHLFNCHSERIHDIVVRLDYAGILFVVASSFAMSLFYGFRCLPLLRNLYLFSALLLDAVLLVLSLRHMPLAARRRLFLGAVLFAAVPLSHLALLYGLDHALLRRVMTVLALYALAFSFYASRFPERWWPGRFDLLGSSHQIWHLILNAAFLYFYFAMEATHDAMLFEPCPMTN